MTKFLLHFFPLFTIFLGGFAVLLLILYLRSIRKIEVHMSSQPA